MVVTPIRKRIKSFLVRTIVAESEIIVRIIVRGKMSRFQLGTDVDIYVSENTLIYERDGTQQLHRYLAIDLKGGRLKGDYMI